MHYIVNGEGSLKINKKTYHLTRGCAFFIFPEQKNFYRAAKKNPWTYEWIAFVGAKAERLLKSINITRSSPVYQCEYSNKINGLFIELFNNLKTRNIGFEFKVKGIFYFILNQFLENSKNISNYRRNNEKEDYITDILNFIATNYQRNLSVYQMAKHLGLNRSYFSSLFKKRMGKSIQSYLIQFRIDKAKEMLLHTNYNISEIAYSVGYNDYFSFVKSFKKNTLCTPKEFKQKYYKSSVQFIS
jgi:AraC-like DNA-binding protein